MIVPMKKVSLIVLDGERKNALKKLRKLGLLHIEIKEGKGPRLVELKEQIASLEKGISAAADKAARGTARKEADTQEAGIKEADIQEALSIAAGMDSLQEEQKKCYADISAYQAELERIRAWGDIDPIEIAFLAEKGIVLSFHEMSPSVYDGLGDAARTIVLERTKDIVRFLLLNDGTLTEEDKTQLERSRFRLPDVSTGELRKKLEDAQRQLQSIKEELEELLRELRMKTPDEIKRYQKIINNKEAILNDAREKAEALINEATAHTTELVSEHEIMQQAYAQANEVVNMATQQAQEILDNATVEANSVKASAIQYTDDILANLEQIIENGINIANEHYGRLIDDLNGCLNVVQANRMELRPDEIDDTASMPDLSVQDPNEGADLDLM